jgi:hypothetical protein
MLRRWFCLVAVLTVTTMMVDDAWGRGPRGGGGGGGRRAGGPARGGVRSGASINLPTPASVGAAGDRAPGNIGPGNIGLGNIQHPAGGQLSAAGNGPAQGIRSQPTTRGQLQDFLGQPADRAGQQLGDRQSGSGDWRGQADQLRSDWQQNHNDIASQRQQHADQIRSQAEQFYNQNNNQGGNKQYDGDSPSDWWNYMWDEHPAYAWWNVTSPVRWATWGAVIGWVGGNGSYSEAVYYDYGYTSTGDELVYVDGEPVAEADEYAASAEELAQEGAATLESATADGTATEMEWLPLGVYALTAAEDDDPIMFVQLAVAKDGTLAGTYFNALTEQQTSVQGAVDSETRRAAFSIGDHSRATLETGIGNLTTDQTPVLVHFGQGRTQTWFMVRLPDAESISAAANASTNASKP